VSVRDEGHFSWDEVEVGEDDRSLLLKSIHTPAHWGDPDAWFHGGRADIAYGEEAVTLLLWLAECREHHLDAARADDPSRQVRIKLDEPLAGRVVVDGVHKLVVPQGGTGRRPDPIRWTRVLVWDPYTLIVYWFGALHGPLDRIDVELGNRAVKLTVLEQPVGKLAGQDKAAIVRLEEPLAGRKVQHGAGGR
jgi:hypothetical protein